MVKILTKITCYCVLKLATKLSLICCGTTEDIGQLQWIGGYKAVDVSNMH
jgi:hypothetical protein